MPSSRDRALSVLLDPALAPIVDMVLWSPQADRYEVAGADGRVRFTRGADGFTVDGVEGNDPLADQSPGLLAGLPAELADPHPVRSANSYPYAFEQVSQLFDHPAAPDLCVVHSAAHNWEDAGGHRGEHGSLGPRCQGLLEVRPRRAAAADPRDLAEQEVRLPPQRRDR